MSVILRYMNGASSSPGEISETNLPTDEGDIVMQVYKRFSRRVDVRRENEQNKDADDVIGRTKLLSNVIRFEALVDGVLIEPLLSGPSLDSFYADGIRLAASSGNERHYHYLRQGDTVNFERQHFKLQADRSYQDSSTARVVTVMAPMANIEADGENIQVRSSHPQPETAMKPEPTPLKDTEGAADSDDDGDLDEPPTTRTRRSSTTSMATPATSLPAKTAGTIKETPGQAAKYEQEEIFSTAREQSETHDMASVQSSAHVVDRDSPLAKKSESQIARLNAGASQASGIVTVAALQSTEMLDHEADDLTAFSPRNVKNTYGKGRPSGNGKRLATNNHIGKRQQVVDSATDNDDADDITLAGPGKIDSEERLMVPPTSEALDTPGVAQKTASRSIRPQGRKRKAADEDEITEWHESLSNKRSKRKGRIIEEPTADRSEGMPGGDQGLDHAHDGDDEVGTADKPRSKRSTGKPRNMTRSPTTDSADNIAVARKTVKPKDPPSSPQVIVKVQRSSTTPSRSTTSSSFDGTSLKIMLSATTVTDQPELLQWLKLHTGDIVDKVPSKRSNFVCVVGTGELPRTAKVLRSLALGKKVVGEDWIADSYDAGRLLDPDAYVHRELGGATESDRQDLFKGKTLFFTSALHKSYGNEWQNVEALVREVGATHVERGAARRSDNIKDGDNVIFLGLEKGDIDATQLISQHGKTVYRKELLTQSIINGEVDLEDENYQVTLPSSPTKKSKKR